MTEEYQREQWSKCCDYNDEDEDEDTGLSKSVDNIFN